ncbi:hypothetical protein [uncultured Microbacterium sp.]|uniref:hypothetical protein n=1 Tax=uncultured Microbacterium sp. TaxID=191216 RepID=UPI0025D9A9C7|nr:hypothetical protein [uncultured Microbacterium sp.]
MAARAAQNDTTDSTPEPEVKTPIPAELAASYVTNTPDPTADQLAVVRQVTGVIATASEQFALLPAGAHRDRAILALEEAAMWGYKAALA